MNVSPRRENRIFECDFSARVGADEDLFAADLPARLIQTNNPITDRSHVPAFPLLSCAKQQYTIKKKTKNKKRLCNAASMEIN